MNKKNYTYIDIFAGCGGLSLGLHNAGWKGIFAIEKSPDAFQTLKHNLIDNKTHFDWPEWLPQTSHDINQVISAYQSNLKELKGQVDMVAGGPPCQGFSSAGRRQENDQRNQLVKSYIEFIKLVQPKMIFFENVKGFTLEFKKNKDKGKTYSAFVVKELCKAGYQVFGDLINFEEFGVPQKRTRFILVGIRKDMVERKRGVAKSFFKKITENKNGFLVSKNLSINTKLEEAISDLLMQHGTIQSPDSKNFQAGLYSVAFSKYQELMRKDVNAVVADSHRFANHKDDIIERFNFILAHSTKNKKIDAATKEKYALKKHRIVPLDKDDQSPTLTTLPDDLIHYCEPRILTVREYARIQTFPDWFEFKGKYTTGGERRTHEVPRYSQIGNAIPPLFGEQSGLILKQLISIG